MKIGILTFHDSVNNGAVMQCYSLSKRLKKEFPESTVEVINYRMCKVKEFYSPTFSRYMMAGSGMISKTKRLVKLLLDPTKLMREAKKNEIFEDAMKKLPLSAELIYSDGTEELFDYINKNYDVVIAGSDAIWNYNMRGYPNPYFLDSKLKPIKLSYAASCYGMVYENIPDEQKKEIAAILDSYHFLGVRDDESARFVSEIGCKSKTVHTCDPTAFLDVNDLPVDTVELEKKLISRGFDKSKQTIGIMGTEDMCKMVRRFYGKKYQIVSLYNYCKSADVNLFNFDPYEWAYMFRFFKVTFTTFFHGTMLSLRSGTPVICIALETDYSVNHKTKVQDFLERVRLEDHYFHTDYKSLNIDEIKKKSDHILNTDMSVEILNRMDIEAETVKIFIQQIENIQKQIGEKEK